MVITSPCFSCTGLSIADPFTCVGFVELKLNNIAYKYKKGEEYVTNEHIKSEMNSFKIDFQKLTYLQSMDFNFTMLF